MDNKGISLGAERKDANYQRKTIIFGRTDSAQLQALIRIGTYNHWPHVNRSTLVRALIRVAAKAFDGTAYPRSDLGVQLGKELHAELELIDAESKRPGVNPIREPEGS